MRKDTKKKPQNNKNKQKLLLISHFLCTFAFANGKNYKQ